MADHIYPKRIKGNTYYYLQKTWRERVDAHQHGAPSNTGKSRVRTQSIYLGTAASIFERLNQQPAKPIEVRHRAFGFVMAVYQTAVDIGLVDLLQEKLTGHCYGVPRWLYFMLPIINRLEAATSKEQMGTWVASTVLPDVLHVNPSVLNSNSFWFATEEVMSEKALRKRRQEHPQVAEELFVGLEDQLFVEIEEKLAARLRQQFNLSWEVLLYDTTNFFTYLEEPARSELARPGHNKAYRHHLKQVGLALCVEKAWGIPLFHRIYRGNSHDSKTFATAIKELIAQIKAHAEQIDQLVLVLDKGNNAAENFSYLHKKIKWVGSVVLAHFADLVEVPLDTYSGSFERWSYVCEQRHVMNIPCTVVLTYCDQLARKQQHTLERGIEKLQQHLQEKWSQYKRRPKHVPAGVLRLLQDSRYGKYLQVAYEQGQLVFSPTSAVSEKQKYFGKQLLFSSELDVSAEWIITQYHAKHKVEDGFKLLKDPGLIRWQPARHWTDTKIRAFAFCCVMSLVLMRVMELNAAQAGLKMSPAVLKEELSDLREVVMVYDRNTAQTQISHRSSVQKKLWDIFKLGIWEKQLTIH